MYVFLSDQAFNPLDVKTGLLFWSAVSFALLFVILSKFGWGPLRAAIESREAGVREDIDASKKARADAEASLAEYTAKLAEAAASAREVVEEARAGAERTAEGIRREAEDRVTAMMDKAEKDIAAAHQKAMSDIKSQIVEVAIAVSKKATQSAMDQAEHERLADEVMSCSGDISR